MDNRRSLVSRGGGPAFAAVGLLAFMAAILVPSHDNGTKRTPISLQGSQDMIEMSGDPASAAGEHMVCAGFLKGSPIGEGALRMISVFHGPRGEATFTVYNGKGTITGTNSTLTTPGPKGSLVGTGTFTITGGTGAYKGATGTGSLQTIQPSPKMMVTKFTLSGTQFQ
jgi:hypothetical protein